MSANVTVMVSLTTELTHSSVLSDELAHRMYQVFCYVLLPCTSVLGIVGNVTSIVILTRRGFKKCSNVLLMALSISDVLFLTGVNNILKYIYVENTPPGLRFSETLNYMLYILYMTFFCAYTVGLQTTLFIPALITVERILVVYSPLRVYFILTPRRVLIFLFCLYIFNGVYFLYRHIICMHFKQIVLQGSTVGVFMYSEVFVKHVRSGLYGLIVSITNYMTGIIPMSIVTSGCVVIGIQVTLIAHRRKQLTSGQVKPGTNKSPSRTTKMLLSICVIYIVCSGFGFFLAYIEEIGLVDQEFALRKVLGCIQDLLLCINCVGDFVIYVRANNPFRKSKGIKP